MKKPKVFVTRKIFDEAIKILEEQAIVEIFQSEIKPIPREYLLEKVKEAEGLLPLITDRIDSKVMDAGTKLKVISNYAVGYNNIDVDAATIRGIRVTNTPDILTDTTADLAFGLILAIARRIVEGDRFIRSLNWVHAWYPKMFVGSDVYDKTLGIVGLGRIGTTLAKRAQGFDMEIIYYDSLRYEEKEKIFGLKYVNFDDLLSQSDFISLHVPLIKNTHHLIGSEELKKMKHTAFLINTSRGPVVDQNALIEALEEGIIAGAALDVFEKEPIDLNSPLFKLNNVVLTPHIGSASIETRKKMAITAAKNLATVLKKEEPPNLVNPEVKKIRPLN
jgi:glyoxylate reductase